MGSSELAVLIPAFNESQSIGKVVNQLSRFAQVIVVDDGSSDGTAEQASMAGATVLSLDGNQGYDRALSAGVEFLSKSKLRGFVTCDADGQHDPADVQSVLMRIREQHVIVGVRSTKARLSEKFFSLVSKPLWGIEDPLCGLKGYSLVNFPDSASKHFAGSTGTGLAIGLISLGSQVENVPISALDREHGRSKFGRVLWANAKIFFSIGVVVWRYSLLAGRIAPARQPIQNMVSQVRSNVELGQRDHAE